MMKMKLIKWAEQVQDLLKWKDIVEKAKTLPDLWRHGRKITLSSYSAQNKKKPIIPAAEMPVRTVSVRKLNSSSFAWNESLLLQQKELYRLTLPFVLHDVYHHHPPPWIRSFELFRHRRVAIVSLGVHDLFFLEVCS